MGFWGFDSFIFLFRLAFELMISISVCLTRDRLAGWGAFTGLGIFDFLIGRFVGR